MQKENLPLALQFPIDRVPNDSLVISGDHRFHWQTIQRGRLDRGHVFYAYEREIKRARNRRRRQREDIDQFEQLLEFFLMQNTEALLFVDDNQAEIFENDIARDQPVRANHNIDAAFAQ